MFFGLCFIGFWPVSEKASVSYKILRGKNGNAGHVSEKLVLFQVARSNVFPPSSPHHFFFKTASKNN